MTDHQFDDLAKALATGASRRTFLKGLGGTALATAFSVFGADRVDARKGKDKDKQKCRGEGHPCVGNGNVCCDGLICAETGPGRVSRCTAPPAGPPSPQPCGGQLADQCPDGYECVDDPNDDCDPDAGGGDCSGICQPVCDKVCIGVKVLDPAKCECVCPAGFVECGGICCEICADPSGICAPA